ncbi:MAG TPA: PilZ domain-containing protein [Candidatus Acidoferrales bacterium]|nr:PilZ domain-containing protein [Candidatus Acidoferrales bacterium]
MAEGQAAASGTRNSALWLTLEDRVNCHIPGQPAIAATLARISEEGAWVRAGLELQVATFMTLEWRGLAERALRLPGQVVGKKQEPDSIVCFYGVRFQNLANPDRDALVGKILEVDRRTKARPERESSIATKVAAQLNTKRAAFRANVSFDTLYSRAGQSTKRLGKASNLSTGGLKLETIEHFDDGSMLDFMLTLPGDVLKRAKLAPSGDKTIHGVSVRPFEKMLIKGRIVKVFREDGNPRWSYGIAFVDQTQHMTDELRRFIHLSQLHELAERGRDT